MSIIRKSFAAVTKALDESKGIVEAFVNTGSVLDLQDDVMEPACWGPVIKDASAGEVDWPSICWFHKPEVITGKVLEAEELQAGDRRIPEKIAKMGGTPLRIVGQYNMETQAGSEAFSNVKGGYVKQWSVGFEPDPATVRYEKGVRFIGKVKRWVEVSNVLIGASPGTQTTGVKSAEPDAEPVFTDRQLRSAMRLKAGLELLEQAKADQPAEAAEAKEAEELEEKAGQVPDLQGPEAVHQKPLQAALDAVKTLISQELAEDEPEPDCVMHLTCIWQDLLSWAQGEAMEYTDYGSLPMTMGAYLRAGIAKLAVPAVPPEAAEQPEEAEAEEWPEWLRAAVEAYSAAEPETPAAAPESPQHSVPEHSDEGLQLPHAMRHRHGRYASYLEPFGPQ